MSTIVQCAYVRLAPGVADTMTVATHNRVAEWLKQWTCRANFPAIIAKSKADGVRQVREQLRESLVPNWLIRAGVSPDMFEFEVAFDEVVEGKFWPSLSCIWCCWHPVKEA